MPASTSSSSSGAGAASPAVAPFLSKVYEMVDDPSTDAAVSWSAGGNSFVISDHHAFGQDLLPKYFKHNNLASFVRQLNTYGFHKVDPDRYEFANEGFLRGQKHLLKTIARKRPTQNTSQPQLPQGKNSSDKPCIEVGKFGLEEDIAMLKRDKNVLKQELVKIRHHLQNSNLQVNTLRQRIQGVDENQQQMLSLLALAVKSPAFLAQLVQQNGNNRWKSDANKKRRLPALEQGAIHDFEPPADGQIVKYQPFLTELSSPDFMQVVDADLGNVQPMSGGVRDLCTDVDAMYLDGDPNLPAEADFSTTDFPDFDFDVDQLLASPVQESNSNEELEPAMYDDFIKDLVFPELESQMDTFQNESSDEQM